MPHEFISFVARGRPARALVGGSRPASGRLRREQTRAALARRARSAAIERGVDLDKLPPVAAPDIYGSYDQGNGRLRRAHGLLIGGAVLVAVGLGLAVLFFAVEPEKRHYVIGVLPFMVGLALIVSSVLVWPRK